VIDPSRSRIAGEDFTKGTDPANGLATFTLDDDGTLYVALQTGNGTGRLHAIKTGSLGFADSPMPIAQFDAAATGWAK
jgi:hypothetical protein